MKAKAIFTVVVIAALSGCATKRYPIMADLSPEEVSLMDCNDLELEDARIATVRRQIDDTADTDWRSVAGFLGDWGIGNSMAKSDASKAVRDREASVRAAKVQKGCRNTVPPATSSSDTL